MSSSNAYLATQRRACILLLEQHNIDTSAVLSSTTEYNQGGGGDGGRGRGRGRGGGGGRGGAGADDDKDDDDDDDDDDDVQLQEALEDELDDFLLSFLSVAPDTWVFDRPLLVYNLINLASGASSEQERKIHLDSFCKFAPMFPFIADVTTAHAIFDALTNNNNDHKEDSSGDLNKNDSQTGSNRVVLSVDALEAYVRTLRQTIVMLDGEDGDAAAKLHRFDKDQESLVFSSGHVLNVTTAKMGKGYPGSLAITTRGLYFKKPKLAVLTKKHFRYDLADRPVVAKATTIRRILATVDKGIEITWPASAVEEAAAAAATAAQGANTRAGGSENAERSSQDDEKKSEEEKLLLVLPTLTQGSSRRDNVLAILNEVISAHRLCRETLQVPEVRSFILSQVRENIARYVALRESTGSTNLDLLPMQTMPQRPGGEKVLIAWIRRAEALALDHRQEPSGASSTSDLNSEPTDYLDVVHGSWIKRLRERRRRRRAARAAAKKQKKSGSSPSMSPMSPAASAVSSGSRSRSESQSMRIQKADAKLRSAVLASTSQQSEMDMLESRIEQARFDNLNQNVQIIINVFSSLRATLLQPAISFIDDLMWWRNPVWSACVMMLLLYLCWINQLRAIPVIVLLALAARIWYEKPGVGKKHAKPVIINPRPPRGPIQTIRRFRTIRARIAASNVKIQAINIQLLKMRGLVTWESPRQTTRLILVLCGLATLLALVPLRLILFVQVLHVFTIRFRRNRIKEVVRGWWSRIPPSLVEVRDPDTMLVDGDASSDSGKNRAPNDEAESKSAIRNE